jgi:hypothetical protein
MFVRTAGCATLPRAFEFWSRAEALPKAFS